MPKVSAQLSALSWNRINVCLLLNHSHLELSRTNFEILKNPFAYIKPSLGAGVRIGWGLLRMRDSFSGTELRNASAERKSVLIFSIRKGSNRRDLWR